MNTQIFELAEQADIYARSDNSSMLFDVWKKRYTERFAELIVRECMMLVEGFESTQEVSLDEYVGYEASAVLKEHFGINDDL